MEQAVWLAFGVIAVVLGFAIVANLMTTNREESRYIHFQESIEKLKNQCDFVCDSPLDAYQSTEVLLPSGLKLYSNGKRICGHLNMSREYEDETKCLVCNCDVNGTLNLQTDLARESFLEHKYSCYFLRMENGVQMECKG